VFSCRVSRSSTGFFRHELRPVPFVTKRDQPATWTFFFVPPGIRQHASSRAVLLLSSSFKAQRVAVRPRGPPFPLFRPPVSRAIWPHGPTNAGELKVLPNRHGSGRGGQDLPTACLQEDREPTVGARRGYRLTSSSRTAARRDAAAAQGPRESPPRRDGPSIAAKNRSKEIDLRRVPLARNPELLPDRRSWPHYEPAALRRSTRRRYETSATGIEGRHRTCSPTAQRQPSGSLTTKVHVIA